MAGFLPLLLAASVRGAEAPAPFSAAFAPLDCETAALSRDGKLLVTVIRAKDTLTAYVTDLDAMTVKTSVLLTKDLLGHRGDSQAHWTSSTRIVIQIGTRDIVAFDADGTSITWLIDWRKEGWFRPAAGRVDEPFYNPFDRSAPPPVVVADPNARPTPLRRVRIVAFPEAEPDFVLVEGIGGRDVEIYRIHQRTGVLETMHRETVDGFVITDRQGRPRLRHLNLGIPHRWEVRPHDGKPGGWVPLGRNLSEPDAQSFDLSVAAMFGTRSFPLGFDEDPNLLYVASNTRRDTYGIYALDLRTGRRTAFALEHPVFDLASPVSGTASSVSLLSDTNLVFDRVTRALTGVRYLGLRSTTLWLDPAITKVQRALEARAPTTSVQIEHWDTARSRFLVQLFSRSDPGSYAIFEPATDRFRHVVPRGPKESPLQPMRTVPWEFKRPDGSALNGEITMPARPRASPVPVAVFFRPTEWSRQFLRYNPQVASLAHLGFAVLEVNHRGLAGFGTAHWIAGRLNPDAVAAEDALAAVDHFTSRLRLDGGKVLFFGYGVGGYFAIRAAQLHPDRTAAVATMNPPINLPEWISPSVTLSSSSGLLYAARRWFFGPDQKVRLQHSPLHHEPVAKMPTLIVSNYGPSTSQQADFEALRKKTSAAGARCTLKTSPLKEIPPSTPPERWQWSPPFSNARSRNNRQPAIHVPLLPRSRVRAQTTVAASDEKSASAATRNETPAPRRRLTGTWPSVPSGSPQPAPLLHASVAASPPRR
ncbi:MAG: prolyl oligopeptidase family serine peptidase [Opitutaceae bacterium]|nr:prolyl oligopeptidase family serine peptidase [Opitutaceae bacterium]